MVSLFSRVDTGENPYIASTLDKDSTNTRQEALIEVYKKLRPGDPPTLDNAQEYLVSQMFDPQRYNLQRVGRYKLNQRMGLNIPMTIWVIVLLVGSQMTSFAIPEGDMQGQMGLAQSDDLKAMLCNGWLIVLFTVLYVMVRAVLLGN